MYTVMYYDNDDLTSTIVNLHSHIAIIDFETLEAIEQYLESTSPGSTIRIVGIWYVGDYV